jgi:NADH dehydrogenase/NADH:ubiquinone oxidoreductase subunit G
MAGIVNIEINGSPVRVREGLTILEAAQYAGVEIPTLCFDEETEHNSSCRMCSIEIMKHGRKRIVAACSYPVEEGLRISTETDRVNRIRKTILELAAVGSGPVVASRMSALSSVYKADLSRFSSRVPSEDSKCILCGLCVNRCKEATYDGVIGFIGRGVERRIVRFPEISEACASCNYCYSVCPTGRITSTGPVPRFPTLNDALSGRK